MSSEAALKTISSQTTWSDRPKTACTVENMSLLV